MTHHEASVIVRLAVAGCGAPALSDARLLAPWVSKPASRAIPTAREGQAQRVAVIALSAQGSHAHAADREPNGDRQSPVDQAGSDCCRQLGPPVVCDGTACLKESPAIVQGDGRRRRGMDTQEPGVRAAR